MEKFLDSLKPVPDEVLGEICEHYGYSIKPVDLARVKDMLNRQTITESVTMLSQILTIFYAMTDYGFQPTKEEYDDVINEFENIAHIIKFHQDNGEL